MLTFKVGPCTGRVKYETLTLMFVNLPPARSLYIMYIRFQVDFEPNNLSLKWIIYFVVNYQLVE